MKQYIVERDLLTNNLGILKKMAGSAKIIANVKCNGYGLGLVPYARFLLENGVDMLGVSAVEEAVALRQGGITGDILMLTSTALDDSNKTLLQNNVTVTVGSNDAAYSVARAGRDLGILPKAHIEINTGMGRSGFALSALSDIGNLKDLPIDFCGTFTHFSFSFSPNKKDVDKQFQPFMGAVKQLQNSGFPTGLLHCANSCAFLQYPKTHLDAVRLGSAILGRIPIPNSYGLKPVGYLQSEVIEINHLKKGDNVGYGNTYTAKKDITTAIIPAGYADGFATEKSKDTFRIKDRIRYMVNDLFKKPMFVTINGQTCPLIGRVGMFNSICDITGKEVKAGDLVILKANPILLDSAVERSYV